MRFDSLLFLIVFLPATLIIYYLVPMKIKNLVLLIASLLFYAFIAPFYLLLLLIAVVVVNYLLGLRLGKARSLPGGGFPVLIVGIVIDLGILFLFRYLGFFPGLSDNSLSGPAGIFTLFIPVGISVYILQAISYLADIYRGDARVQKNIVKLGVYMTMFPRIFNGPIVQYNEIEAQLGRRTLDFKKFLTGSWIFVIGLAKQTVLAAGFNGIYENIAGKISEQAALPGMAWIGAAAYMLYIYFYLSGFSNMAMGMGRMLGFKFPANFNYPFTAKSITDFWGRWNITLVGWMRRYFRPLFGSSRLPAGRDILSLIVIWSLIGLWHGPSLNMLVWGLYFALILMLEKYVWGRALKQLPAAVRHLYSLLLILIGWVIYFSDSLADAGSYLKLMFGYGEYSGRIRDVFYLLTSNWPIFVIGIICATAIPLALLARRGRDRRGRYVVKALEGGLYFLAIVCILSGSVLCNTFRSVTGNAAGNSVILGWGGQLFKENPDPDEEAINAAANGINSYASSNPDVNTCVLLVPDSSEVLKHRLPILAPVADETDMFNDINRILNADVTWLDGTAAIENSEADRLYYKTDSHWTTEAAYDIFLAVSGEMGIDNAADVSYSIYCAADDFNGDLSLYSGFCANMKEELYVCLPDEMISYLVDYCEGEPAVPSAYDTSYLDNGSAYDLFFGGDHALMDIETAGDSTRVILVVGDSYARAFVPFLIPHFGEIVMVNPNLYSGSIYDIMSEYNVSDTLFLYSGDEIINDISLGYFLGTE